MNPTNIIFNNGVGQLVAKPGWEVPRHDHPFHELIIILRGVAHVWIGGEHVRGTVGDLWLFPKRTGHHETCDAQGSLDTIFFGFQAKGIPSGRLIASHDTEGRIRQMALWMIALAQAHPPRMEPELQSLTQAIVTEFVRNREYQASELVTRVRQHVREHVADPLTLDGLARMAGLSKFHFVRRYRALTGRTPMADVRAIRADHARDLILTTNLALKEIAPRAGLGNEYTLSRVFRKRYNMSPGQLRRGR
jgi:AraC-like DNA-binding protein